MKPLRELNAEFPATARRNVSKCRAIASMLENHRGKIAKMERNNGGEVIWALCSFRISRGKRERRYLRVGGIQWIRKEGGGAGGEEGEEFPTS